MASTLAHLKVVVVVVVAQGTTRWTVEEAKKSSTGPERVVERDS